MREEDVRIASRYPWDLGITTGDGAKSMMVAYWTQNYRRTKSEDADRDALFLCETVTRSSHSRLPTSRCCARPAGRCPPD